MNDLVLWLRAQLDDDERVARAAERTDASPWRFDADHDPSEGKIRDAGGFTVVHVEDSTPEPDTAEHIARWDPARVLAEVDAKRRIIDWVEGTWDSATNCDFFGVDREQFYRLLALSYAEREGYRPEWRPADPERR